MEPSSSSNSFDAIMTSADASQANLTVLIDHFVAFLREQQKQQALSSAGASPEGLARVFDTFSHHLAALMLLAKSDDRIASSERAVVARHCVERAQKAGLAMTPEEIAALDHYLHHFRPTEMQFLPAIERLKHDSKEDLASLIAAAHAVVEADGVVRLQEALYLSALLRELHAP
jgi:hypothetical protein